MKKNVYLLLFFSSLMLFAYSQSQRLVLLEHFTQASCGPCATYNPQINSWLNANPDKFTAIMVHTSWPGYDPMYNQNPTESGSRTTFYSINSVPHSVIDGNYFNGHPANWNMNTINTRYAEPSPFNIHIHQEMSPDNTTVYVDMLIEATEDVSADVKAFATVIEKHIHFNSPPGSNGETDFYNVMKKYLPSTSGYALPTFETGDYIILQQSWDVQNIYNLDELASIGFIQKNSNKEVLQAANSSADALTPLHTNDAEILDVANITVTNCLGTASPVVTIRNNGSQALTSLDLEYSVNGGDVATYSWTGNLGFLEKDVIELPEITFDVMPENELSVHSTSTNGGQDDYQKNDILNIPFEEALHISNQLRVVIITDDNPDETTWEVTNSSGEAVLSGGPYAEPGHVYQEYYDIDLDDCYHFVIYDAGGDGLCCENGAGAWGLYDADGNIEIGTGGIFGASDSANFEVGGLIGIDSHRLPKATYKIYPNPVSVATSLHLEIPRQMNVSYQLVNLVGEKVKNENLGLKMQGSYDVGIVMDDLKPGVYFITLHLGDQTETERIIKLK